MWGAFLLEHQEEHSGNLGALGDLSTDASGKRSLHLSTHMGLMRWLTRVPSTVRGGKVTGSLCCKRLWKYKGNASTGHVTASLSHGASDVIGQCSAGQGCFFRTWTNHSWCVQDTIMKIVSRGDQFL